MFKLMVSVLLIFSNIASADANASRVECKTRCWGAEKASEGVTQGINDVLKQKETKTGAYQKKYKELSEKLRNSERNTMAMRLLEYDPVSNIQNFSIMLIKKNIARRTNAAMCFERCGSARILAQQPIDFMDNYFMTVIVSFSMEDLKKAFLYAGTPFDTHTVQDMLDSVAKNIKQEKLEEILAKSKDNQVINFIKDVREGKNSFKNLRPSK